MGEEVTSQNESTGAQDASRDAFRNGPKFDCMSWETFRDTQRSIFKRVHHRDLAISRSTLHYRWYKVR